MKLHKSKKDPELYYYYNSKKEKMWMYRHKYYDSLGKRKEKKKSGFKTEKDAIKVLLEVKAAVLNGEVKKVENSNLTVSKWLDIWYETYSNDWEVTTRIQRKQRIDEIIKPRIGNRQLSKLDKTTYKRIFINDLLKTYKHSSVHQFHSTFTTAINAAVEDEILSHNRFTKIKIEKDDVLDNFLTPTELNVFLEISRKRNNITSHTIILLLAYTGLRQGEAFGLKWKNINFKEKTITVERTRDNHGVRSPKTKNSYRTIAIDNIPLQQLKVYQKWCMETKFKYGLKMDKSDDYVFISNQSGSPCSYMVIQHAFKMIYKQCEKEKNMLKKITPHGLRHTHATVLINNGIPPKTIAERLGNTINMILNVYSHSFKEIEDKAVSVFSESLSNGAKTGAN